MQAAAGEAQIACRPETLPDTRALWLHRLTSSPVSRLVGLVHGRLLPLHDLLSAALAGGHVTPAGTAGWLRGTLALSLHAYSSCNCMASCKMLT